MSADLTRQFVDTNILIYAYDSSAGVKYKLHAPIEMAPSRRVATVEFHVNTC